MRKSSVIIILSLLFSVNGFSQLNDYNNYYLRATIKPGTTPNSVDIYFKPFYNNIKTYFDNINVTVAIPTQTPSPTATITPRNINGLTWDESLAGTGTTESGAPYAGYTFYTFIGALPTDDNAVPLVNGTEFLALTITFAGSAGLENVYLVSLDNIAGGLSMQRYTYLEMSGSSPFNPGPYGPIGQVSQDPTAGGILYYATPGVSVMGQFESGSPFVRTVSNISLPVKLESFTAVQTNCAATLNWTTAGEVDFNRFEVEESTDGATFSKIGAVTALGSTGQNKYTYNAGVVNSKKFFRLKMVDNNGKSSYSKVLMVSDACNTKGISAIVYPNPASKGTGVNVNLQGFNGPVSGKLFDAAGKLLQTQALQNGTNFVATERLAAGMYQFLITDAAGNMQAKKIVISN